VDNIAITGPDNDYISEIISKLSKRFAITDLGPITSYLGVEIKRTTDYKTTILSQKDYIIKVLKKFKMDKSNSVSTPIDIGFIRQKYDKTSSNEDTKWYQQAIGSLLYAALLTRPDIAYATSMLGRYASNPGPEHIKAVKRVFRYLKGSLNYSITYSGDTKTSLYITGYTDADYAGDKDEYKSTTGYIFYLANGPISYKSKLQPITAQSTTEAEYIALANATKEATYIKALITELGLYKQSNIPIYSDNNGAIQLAKNPAYHERSKHINVRYHLIRQKLADNTISIHYIPTKDQKADGLTKPLSKTRFKEFIDLI
jgi:phosphopantetheinyl transferase (holo-ACP synthase)